MEIKIKEIKFFYNMGEVYRFLAKNPKLIFQIKQAPYSVVEDNAIVTEWQINIFEEISEKARKEKKNG